MDKFFHPPYRQAGFGLRSSYFSQKNHKNRSLSSKELLILILSLPFNSNSMLLEIPWMVFFASAAIQLIYLLIIFGRLAFFHDPSKSINLEDGMEEGVSIVVASSKELKNLTDLLAMLVSQGYLKNQVRIV